MRRLGEPSEEFERVPARRDDMTGVSYRSRTVKLAAGRCHNSILSLTQ